MNKIEKNLLSLSKKNNIWRYNVAAIFLNKKGEVLLCQRAPTKKFKPNLWHLPGGKIENLEGPYKAINREIMEEIGVQSEVICYCDVDYIHKDENNNLHQTSFIFCMGSGSAKLDYESQSIKWVSTQKIKELFIDANKDDRVFYQICQNAITKCQSINTKGLFSSNIKI